MRGLARATGLVSVALVLSACQGNGRIRLFVEPTYEQDKLQQLLAPRPDLHLLVYPGSEDIALRVEAVPQPAPVRSLRAIVRARARRTGYEVHAVAELLPHKSNEVIRARWVNSYSREILEDTFADILYQVVVEAARGNHKDFQRTREEVERAAAAIQATSSP